MKKVVVASTNPVKINTARDGFTKMFPDEQFEFEGISVTSEIPSQPMSNEQTLEGALNRVKNAKKIYEDADYWIGLEGGVSDIGGEMRSFAWIVVSSKDGIEGKSRTADFALPKIIANLVREGKELGEADDIVFKKNNSKQSNGGTGLLTNDIITRKDFYEQAVILALIPFKNEDLYKEV